MSFWGVVAISFTASAAQTFGAGLRFGLAGHAGFPAQRPYQTLDTQGQISRINGLGMTSYRAAGLHWDFTTFGPYGAEKLKTYVDTMHAAGIEPIIVLDPAPQEKTSEMDAYNSAYDFARYVAQVLAGKGIKYYEIGNEYDMGMVVTGYGHLPSDFDTTMYNKARGVVKGLMAGVRSVTSSGQFLVGGSGLHWGYTQRLYDDGIRWDITKFHWYSTNDRDSTAAPATDFSGYHYNLFEILSKFQRPLICTEVGVTAADFNYDNNKMAAWFDRMMTQWFELAPRYDFQLACIYQMLDQPQSPRVDEQTIGLFRGDDGHVGEDKPQAVTVRKWMTNKHPIVTAGSDQIITLPTSATLSGSATDDGLPNPPAALTYKWRKVDGPGAVVFADRNAPRTTASFSVEGTYTLTLIANDSIRTGSDKLAVTVLPSLATPSPTPTPTTKPVAEMAADARRKLINVSVRTDVQTGDNVTVGGFIITGDSPKQVVLRAIGPSLAAAGVIGAMANPKLDLHDSTGSVIASNDDWKPSSKLPPTLVPRDRGESILTVTLPPGAYSAVLQGASSDTGIALFELYDIDTAHSSVANISTRGRIGTGDAVMISGFMVGGATGRRR